MLPTSIEGPPAKQRKRLRKNNEGDADDSVIELDTMKNTSFYGNLADNMLKKPQASSFRKASDSS